MVEDICLRRKVMDSREWKAFRIEEVFIVVDGFYNKKPPMTNGTLPFLGATEKNNGITGYTDLETISKWTKTGEPSDNSLKNKVFGPNWIAVTNNGSVGHAYFMPHRYTSSHDVTSLYLPDREISEELGLFLVKMLERAGEPFSYARKWRPIRLRKTPIYLPVTDTGVPDWSFMEEYIQIKSNQIREAYQLPKLHEIKDCRELDEVEWREYLISDYFEVNKEKGSESNMDALLPGNTPLISARKINNGLKDFVTALPRKIKSPNVITWNKDGDGGAGLAYYQEFKFAVDSHVFVLYAKFPANKYNQLFIVTLLSKYKDIFNHGRANSLSRFKAEKIMLPSKNGLPDFLFMEQYMKRMENRVLQKMEQ